MRAICRKLSDLEKLAHLSWAKLEPRHSTPVCRDAGSAVLRGSGCAGGPWAGLD